MTKELCAQTRAICEAATPGPWNAQTGILELTDADIMFISHARTALPAALDYIEQLEAEQVEKRENPFCPECGCSEHFPGLPNGEKICQKCGQSYFDDIDYSDIIGKHFRESIARAEALERAIKSSLKGCECLCDMCKKEPKLCESCVFEFAVARFSDKPTPCQEVENKHDRQN